MSEKAVQPISRREMLYYIWGASAMFLAAASCGVAATIVTPRTHQRQIGAQDGLFEFKSAVIPTPGSAPILYLPDKTNPEFWLSSTTQGFVALSPCCPRELAAFHIKENFKWSRNEAVPHFRCPNCGSQYWSDGTYITGIARQDIARYVVTVETPNGARQTPSDGSPVDVHDATAIIVDVQQLIPGKFRNPPQMAVWYKGGS